MRNEKKAFMIVNNALYVQLILRASPQSDKHVAMW